MSRAKAKPAPKPKRAPTEELTEQQRPLYNLVTKTTSDVGEQVQVVWSLALRVGASSRDVEAVRMVLLAGRTRECADRR
jgi:hypothetical protein